MLQYAVLAVIMFFAYTVNMDDFQDQKHPEGLGRTKLVQLNEAKNKNTTVQQLIPNKCMICSPLGQLPTNKGSE